MGFYHSRWRGPLEGGAEGYFWTNGGMSIINFLLGGRVTFGTSVKCDVIFLWITFTHKYIGGGGGRRLNMDDQLSLLLRREGLRQDDRCRGFWGRLNELHDLDTSQTVLRVVIITTDMERIVRFVFVLIISRLWLGLVELWVVIFILVIPTLPFFRFILTDRIWLNNVHV